MRVLVVTNDLPPRVGGIQYYVDQLCRGMVAAGDTVVVYASTSRGSAEFDRTAPYEVIRERSPVLLPTLLVRRRAVELVKRMDAEVIVFGAAFPLGLMGAHIRSCTGVPYLSFTHGLEVSAVRMPFGSAVLGQIGRKADVVTYVSNWCESLLAPAFGSHPEHVLLPPGIDDSEFNEAVSGVQIRALHGLENAPLIVCVSRLVERKGQDKLIGALSAIRSEVPDARLMIVGGGPQRGALERLADRLGHSDHVVFAGQVPEGELPKYYAAADVFAMPCRERRLGLEVEAFGIVFIQAQAVGVPVVAGNIGGVPDTLIDGKTGSLVDGTSTSEVASAVARLLNDQDRAEMGEMAARRVRENFTWTARTQQLRDLLSQMADRASE